MKNTMLIIAMMGVLAAVPAHATDFLFHRALPTMGGTSTNNGTGGSTGGSSGGSGSTPTTGDTITLADYNNGYLPFGAINKAYNFDMKSLASITGTTHTVSDLIWSVSGGAFPSGLALATTGEITGVPSTATNSAVQIKAETPDGSGQRVYNVVINNVVVMQATKVVGGYYHTCAIGTDKGVKCWGDNYYGQLGDGTVNDSTVPVSVINLPADIVDIASGENHVCAISASQGAKCWGRNTYGQAGDGIGTMHQHSPISVVGLPTDLSLISAGRNFSCAVSTSQGLMCWGENNAGQIGDGTTSTKLTPTVVAGLPKDITKVDGGYAHACAVSASVGMKCWGANAYGQVGNNTFVNVLNPTSPVGLPSDITQIALGDYHTCAASSSAGLKCWGANGYGQLGTGSRNTVAQPATVSGGLTDIYKLTAGSYFTCGLSTSQGMKCWGQGDYAQMGNNTSNQINTVPISVNIPNDVGYIGAGSFHVCASSGSKGLNCWGYNGNGGLGDGTMTDRYVPTQVILP